MIATLLALFPLLLARFLVALALNVCGVVTS